MSTTDPLLRTTTAASDEQSSGPKIAWTVADIFKTGGNHTLFMTYHVMGTSWDFGSPVGCLMGAGLYGIGLGPSATLWQSMGTVGLGLGGLGMLGGAVAIRRAALQGEAATPPWNAAGLANRVDRLSRNFLVRVLDASAWSGMAVAAVAMAGGGGPAALGLAPGTLGVLQGLTLGSSAGSVAAMACVSATKKKKKPNDNNDKNPTASA